MKTLLILGVTAILTLLNFIYIPGYAAAKCGNPALTLWSRFYGIRVKYDKKYYVIPYNDNIIALYFLKKDKNIRVIKNYILWYSMHLNYPDKFGLTGTMYDYIISKSGCTERSTETYDSADSYAATYLTMIYAYYKKTKDIATLNYVYAKLKDVAYIIPYLQDANNGLIKALPDKDEEYLMDNCEDYEGMTSYLGILEITGNKFSGEYNRYKNLKKSMKAAIISNLFNHRRHNFDWSIIRGKKYHSKWSVYYPDAFAQLFPIFYNITKGSPVSSIYLWNKFESIYKNKPGLFAPVQKMLYILTKQKMHKP